MRDAIIGGISTATVGVNCRQVEPKNWNQISGVLLTKNDMGRVFIPESNIVEVEFLEEVTTPSATAHAISLPPPASPPKSESITEKLLNRRVRPSASTARK